MTPPDLQKLIDQSIENEIEDWMEARENERYKWGEVTQPELDFKGEENEN